MEIGGWFLGAFLVLVLIFGTIGLVKLLQLVVSALEKYTKGK